MSASAIEILPVDLEVAPQLSGSVRRLAGFIDSRGQPLFTWLHCDEAASTANHGVVICPPIGYEQLHAHRTLRHLADRIARHGIPVLRFDWHGTGDSAGTDEDPDRCPAWIDNVRDVVHWMRDQLKCDRVSVVGLRMGATLASLALDDVDVEVANLVLWAPVRSGRAFVREMTAIDRTSETRTTPVQGESAAIEAAGFVLSPETAAELSRVNLLESHPRCRRALIVERDDAPSDPRLRDWLGKLGVSVEQAELPGFAEMLVEPHHGRVAETAIDEISSWLSRQVAAVTSVTRDIAVRSVRSFPATESGRLDETLSWIAGRTGQFFLPREATMNFPTDRTVGAVNNSGIRERAIRLSDDPDLFGILCEPASPPPEERPVIMLVNAGSAYRIGPGRLSVEMARHFAAQGFRSLRMDICGLGDSVTANASDENNSYAGTAFRDIQIALRELRSRFGMQRCVLMGLCSGAYAALQSAVQIDDPSLVESVLINPLTFFWQDGMTIESSPTRHLRTQHYYWSVALQPSKWWKLLSGQSRIGWGGAIRLLARRLRLGSPSRSQSDSPTKRSIPTYGSVTHPEREDLPADLNQAVAKGRHLAMFFSRSDPGYSILTHLANRAAKRLHRRGKLHLAFIDDADHTFSRQAPRRELIRSLCQYLQERFAEHR